MKQCEMCSNPVDGSRICFDCMFDLAEEERIARIRNSKWVHRGEFVPQSNGYSYRYAPVCSHCWPFDCGCL